MIEVILILWRTSEYPQKLPDTNETLWIIQGYGYDRFVCMLILFIFGFLFMFTQSHCIFVFVTVVHWVSFFACVMYEWTICFYEQCFYFRYRDSRYFILFVIIIIVYFGNVQVQVRPHCFPQRQTPEVLPS
jgi:hypothetical protein